MSVDELLIWNAQAMADHFPRARTVAIVGNGAVDAESTSHIEQADVVVRFNNWATRSFCVEHNLPHSTGRCDLLVTHCDLHSGNQGKGGIGRPSLVVIGIPAPFHIDVLPARIDKWYPDCRVAIVNPYWNRQLCQSLALKSEGWQHPLPTLGMTALYHLGRMELGYEYYVCGFDWHFDPERDTIQEHAVDAQKLPGHYNHWYVKEAVWIARSLWQRPKWSFSSRAARTLRRLAGKTFRWEQDHPLQTLDREPHSVGLEEEDRRYSELYRGGYGAGPVAPLLRWCREVGVELEEKRVIDCGCGRAVLLRQRIPFAEYLGIDIASSQIEELKQQSFAGQEVRFHHGSLDCLPCADGAFDVAWCCDVLEHLALDEVDLSMREMGRVAAQAVFSICTRPSKILDGQGRNLHQTVRPAEWWRERVSRHGRIEAQRASADHLWLVVRSRRR